jgi:hypothetical protein
VEKRSAVDNHHGPLRLRRLAREVVLQDGRCRSLERGDIDGLDNGVSSGRRRGGRPLAAKEIICRSSRCY